MTRQLLVLRHAKSSWDDDALDDHERPLAKRGRKAVKRLRRHLGELDLPIDLVLCSSAVRTVQTLDGIREALPTDVAVRIEEDLYGASPRRLLDRLRRIPASQQHVLLVGHNPALQELIVVLTRDGEARQRVVHKYPTGGLARLDVDGTWSDLTPGRCTLRDFVVPRELA